MKKKQLKYITLSILCLLSVGILRAQQLPQFSQYQFNEYTINPAVAGAKPYFEATSNHRYQWAGILDAPRTFTLSVQGPTKSNKTGIGGYVYTDVTGPTRRFGAQLSYSYKLRLTEKMNLSFALSFGFLQYSIDGGKLSLYDVDDPLIFSQLITTTTPDAKAGVYLYTDTYYVGLSVPQLLHSRLGFVVEDQKLKTDGRLSSHYILHGGYKHKFNDTWAVEPTALIKFNPPAPLKIDIGARVLYQNKVWLGLQYRTNDAFVGMIGYVHKEQLEIGYSYDMTSTDIKNYSSGTHELMIKLRFHPTRKGLKETPKEEE